MMNDFEGLTQLNPIQFTSKGNKWKGVCLFTEHLMDNNLTGLIQHNLLS